MNWREGVSLTEEQFQKCIERMKKKDRLGLKEVYDAYLSYIYRIVLGIVGRKEDAEDITSEFFIRLYQTADKFSCGSGHKGYIATIARNMAIDFMRKNRREVLESFSKEDDDESVFEPVSKEDTESEVVSNTAVAEALSKLKDKERVIVDMKILSEMTFEEIAEKLKIPLGTVTWRYREAIKKLRRYGYEES